MLEKVISILFLSGDAVPIKKLADFLAITKEEILENAPFVKSKLEELGLTLLVSNEGMSITTKKENAELIEAWIKEDIKGGLTPAALQTLTLIAYLGFPTREQISYIRGVQSSQSIRLLAVRGLISRVGEVCSLTSLSLKQLGITDVKELPDYEKIHSDLLTKLQERNL
jgi:segregation and condensation protein B